MLLMLVQYNLLSKQSTFFQLLISIQYTQRNRQVSTNLTKSTFESRSSWITRLPFFAYFDNNQPFHARCYTLLDYLLASRRQFPRNWEHPEEGCLATSTSVLVLRGWWLGEGETNEKRKRKRERETQEPEAHPVWSLLNVRKLCH